MYVIPQAGWYMYVNNTPGWYVCNSSGCYVCNTPGWYVSMQPRMVCMLSPRYCKCNPHSPWIVGMKYVSQEWNPSEKSQDNFKNTM